MDSHAAPLRFEGPRIGERRSLITEPHCCAITVTRTREVEELGYVRRAKDKNERNREKLPKLVLETAEGGQGAHSGPELFLERTAQVAQKDHAEFSRIS